MYPNHADLLHPDYHKYVECVGDVAGVVGLGMGLTTDPMGSASSTFGSQLGCDNECK